MKKERRVEIILGIYFILLQILVLFRNYSNNENYYIFFFCNHIPLIFAIGFFTKNTQLIKSLISFGLLVQIIWIIDLLGKVLFHIELLGVTNYVFEVTLFSLFVTLLIHLTDSNTLFEKEFQPIYYAMVKFINSYRRSVGNFQAEGLYV